jgi:hypothetical protein
VLDESIDSRHDGATREVWLVGRFTYTRSLPDIPHSLIEVDISNDPADAAKAFDDFFERRSPQQSRIVTVSEAQLDLYLNGASGDIGAKTRSEHAGRRLVLIENAAKAHIGSRVIGNSKIRMIEQIEEL